MPEPYKGNRGIAQNIISAMIDEGYLNTQITDFLRLNDYGYRNQLMIQDINRLRLESFGAAEIRSMSISDPVPDRFMREWHGSMEYKYRVVVEYDYYDTNTLDIRRTGTTIYYNAPPSQEEVLRDWEIRRQTIENTYGNVQEVMGEVKVGYFRNAK
jgi:hypothetical protein